MLAGTLYLQNGRTTTIQSYVFQLVHLRDSCTVGKDTKDVCVMETEYQYKVIKNRLMYQISERERHRMSTKTLVENLYIYVTESKRYLISKQNKFWYLSKKPLFASPAVRNWSAGMFVHVSGGILAHFSSWNSQSFLHETQSFRLLDSHLATWSFNSLHRSSSDRLCRSTLMCFLFSHTFLNLVACFWSPASWQMPCWPREESCHPRCKVMCPVLWPLNAS